jgi:succinate dehydrogenase/fumarate reductase flavoprotein subunit
MCAFLVFGITNFSKMITLTTLRLSGTGPSPARILNPRGKRHFLRTAIVQPKHQIVHRQYSSSEKHKFDETTDVLIVGSGAAGLLAAARLHESGLKPLLIEKSDKIGGASCYSGGAVWIPNSHIASKAGVPDSFKNALKYLESVIEDCGPASSRERKIAFLENGPKMVKWLEDVGFKWVLGTGYPDYYPHAPGGCVGGRSIEGHMFDVKKLGQWLRHLNVNPGQKDAPFYTKESPNIARMASWGGMKLFLSLVFSRVLPGKLLGEDRRTMGRSLVSQLLYLNIKRDIPIWRSSPLIKLLVEDGKVIGAKVFHDDKEINVRAKKGVILSAGGFAKNQKMREKYQMAPATNKWTSVPPYDHGNAITAGMDIGAATALMDDAWWGPTVIDPADGVPRFILWERAMPHSIIVDCQGNRFMNEAEPYTDAGHHQYEQNQKVPAIPAWMILDKRHRNKYMLSGMPPRQIPNSALKSGFIVRAHTLADLARKIKVDVDGLASTIKNFNEMAARGIDDDFDRGASAYDSFFGDPKCKPNPNLGSLEKSPFYALQIWPGDLGTKGGLLTDENARVMDQEGKPILNLYGAGNTTASVMGRTYAGAGATLGPAMTFAFIAVNHIVLKNND